MLNVAYVKRESKGCALTQSIIERLTQQQRCAVRRRDDAAASHCTLRSHRERANKTCDAFQKQIFRDVEREEDRASGRYMNDTERSEGGREEIEAECDPRQRRRTERGQGESTYIARVCV